MNNRGAFLTALAGVTVFNLLGVVTTADAATIELIGLSDNNTLVSFSGSDLSNTTNIGITGLQAGETLVGIDFRPADGQLFGVSTANRIFTINPTTGLASLVSTNPTSFTLNGTSFGVDFNPNPDRIRVVSDADQNLRLNPNTGGIAINPNETPAVDGMLSYAAGDPNSSNNPNIVAEAYTNSFAPSPDATRRTTLYGIDSNLDILVTQGSVNFLTGDPAPAVSPNTGQLFTVGSLGIDFNLAGGFDILTTNGVNTAFAASGSTLYNINLSNGAATSLGTIGNGSSNIVGLTARSVPEPSTVTSLLGFGILVLLGSRCGYAKVSS